MDKVNAMTIAGPERSSRAGSLIPLALLTVVAGLVRAGNVGQGFWYDEIFSLTHFFRSDWATLFTTMPVPNHHPLYSALAKLSILALGEKEWTARLPALIAGTATVPVLYVMGERFVSRRAGLAASLLLCFNMWHVYYSTDARGYSLMILLTLLCWFFFLLMMESPTRGRAIAYIAVSVGALYTHLYSIGVPGAHLAVALVLAARGGERRRERLMIAAVALAALVIALLCYLPMIPEMIRYVHTEGRIIGTREFSGRFVLGLLFSWASGTDQVLVSLPLLVTAGAGFFLMGSQNRVMIFSWLLPLLIGFAVPLFSHTFVYHRFFSFAMPGFFLAAGWALDWISRRLSLPGWAAGALIAVLVTMLLPELYTYYRLGKQGLRPAAQWIQEQAPGAKVISLGLARKVFQYYCPEAIALEKDHPLDRQLLSNSVVVFAFPWSVNRAKQQYLEQVCGPPLVFPAAGYQESELRLYRCNLKEER